MIKYSQYSPDSTFICLLFLPPFSSNRLSSSPAAYSTKLKVVEVVIVEMVYEVVSVVYVGLDISRGRVGGRVAMLLSIIQQKKEQRRIQNKVWLRQI